MIIMFKLRCTQIFVFYIKNLFKVNINGYIKRQKVLTRTLYMFGMTTI